MPNLPVLKQYLRKNVDTVALSAMGPAASRQFDVAVAALSETDLFVAQRLGIAPMDWVLAETRRASATVALSSMSDSDRYVATRMGITPLQWEKAIERREAGVEPEAGRGRATLARPLW
jgi:hypothetical protein